SKRAELTYIKERTVPALIAHVRRIPPQSLILYMRYSPVEPVANLYPSDVARLIADASPVPLHTVSDVYLGSGVVGGMMRAAEAAGTRIGEISRQVLDGKRPGALTVAARTT